MLRCVALWNVPYRKELEPGVALLALGVFVATSAASLYLATVVLPLGPKLLGTGTLVSIALLLGVFLTRYVWQPGNRGRLMLFRDALEFRPQLGSPIRIALERVVRVHLIGSAIHVILDRGDYSFSCPRLHAEDVHDQLMAQIDGLDSAAVREPM